MDLEIGQLAVQDRPDIGEAGLEIVDQILEILDAVALAPVPDMLDDLLEPVILEGRFDLAEEGVLDEMVHVFDGDDLGDQNHDHLVGDEERVQGVGMAAGAQVDDHVLDVELHDLAEQAKLLSELDGVRGDGVDVAGDEGHVRQVGGHGQVAQLGAGLEEAGQGFLRAADAEKRMQVGPPDVHVHEDDAAAFFGQLGAAAAGEKGLACAALSASNGPDFPFFNRLRWIGHGSSNAWSLARITI